MEKEFERIWNLGWKRIRKNKVNHKQHNTYETQNWDKMNIESTRKIEVNIRFSVRDLLAAAILAAITNGSSRSMKTELFGLDI